MGEKFYYCFWDLELENIICTGLLQDFYVQNIEIMIFCLKICNLLYLQLSLYLFLHKNFTKREGRPTKSVRDILENLTAK